MLCSASKKARPTSGWTVSSNKRVSEIILCIHNMSKKDPPYKSEYAAIQWIFCSSTVQPKAK